MLPWHRQVLEGSMYRRFAAIIAHRKARKTLLAIKEIDRWAQAVPGIYWHIFPKLDQARRTIWDDPDMMARNVLPSAWAARNKSDHYIAYPNGSKYYVLGANNPDSLRGSNPQGVVLDEYDDMHISVWAAIIQPIMSANPDAWCWLMGTYKGAKDLYAKHKYAEENPENWYTIVVKASESGIIDAEALADAKRNSPQAFYDMEYECIPVEGGTSYFTRIRDNLWPGALGQLDGRVFKLGVDLAKMNDWTVITPVDVTDRVAAWGEDEKPFLVGMPERFNRIDWVLQRARIKAAWGLYNKAVVTLDATGLGGPIVDDLRSENVAPLEAITFTADMRRDLLNNLQLMLAEDKVKIPDFAPLVGELEAFSYEVNRNGRLSIEVPEGQHDDCVMSLALALWKAKKERSKAQNAAAAMTPGQPLSDPTDSYWNGG